MALFPIVSNQVQLSSTAPVGTDNYVRAVLLDAGNTVARAATSGGVQYANGLLFTSTGQVVYVDATAGLPAGTQYVNGLPLSPTGALCISSGAVATWSNGLPFAANGALCSVGGTDPLARFKTGGVSGKTATFWGDSTMLNTLAGSLWGVLTNDAILPDGELAGLNVVNKGSNGQTMAGANSTEAAGIYATNPDLVVLGFGINDVRQGGVDAPTLAARIATAVAGIQTNKPNCDIVLWTPNALASTDETGLYILPSVASSQAYTDIMWNAYNSLRGAYAHVQFVDKQASLGRICVPEPGPYMTDALHPNAAGQIAVINALIPYLMPVKTPINLASSAAAWTSNPNNPWTVYSRALEDTRYCREVCRFQFTLFMDLGSTVLAYLAARHDNFVGIDYHDFQVPGRFWWTPSNGVYTITGSENAGLYNGNGVEWQGVTLANFLGGTSPAVPSNARLYQRLP